MEYSVDESMLLLFNPARGALALTERHFWDNIQPYKLNQQEEKLLKETGFLPGGEYSSDQAIAQFRQLKLKTRPTTFFITPQLDCPMGCVYCFQQNSRSTKRLQPQHIAEIDDFIVRYAAERNLDNSKIALVLFGGEPLLPSLREFNRNLLKLAKHRGYAADIVTSGVSIDQYYLDLTSQYAEIIREVNITLDGSAGVHNRLRPTQGGGDSYTLIKENVDKLLDRGIRVLVKTNFGHHTCQGAENFLRDMQNYGWFERYNFVFAASLVREYGKVSTQGEVMDEGELVIRMVELFRSQEFSHLLPKLRLESLRLTDNLAHAFKLLEYHDPKQGQINLFDGYPKYAACHPGDGTTVNISYDGRVYSCNWMVGKEHLSVGSIFAEYSIPSPQPQDYIYKNQCKACDIRTLCGGGCLIEAAEDQSFYQDCYTTARKTIDGFIRECIRRGWLETDLGPNRFRVIRPSFDFNYRYESRLTR